MASAQGIQKSEEIKVHNQEENLLSESDKKCAEKEREFQDYEEIGMEEGKREEAETAEKVVKEREIDEKVFELKSSAEDKENVGNNKGAEYIEKIEKDDRDVLYAWEENKEEKEKDQKEEKKEKKETPDVPETKHKKEKKKEKKESKYSVERLKQKLEKIESKMQKLVLKKEECLNLMKEEQRNLQEGKAVHDGEPTITGHPNEHRLEKLGDEVASLNISDTKVEAVAMSKEGCNEEKSIEDITYTKVEASVVAADK